MAAAKSIKVKVTGISLAQTPAMPGADGNTVEGQQFFNVTMLPTESGAAPGQPNPGTMPLTFMFTDTSGIEVGQVYELALTKVAKAS